MRDPNRLDEFYAILCKVHKESFPDLRFGQLCCNFFIWIDHNTGLDPFFIEENKMIKLFTEYCNTYGGSWNADRN